MAERQVQKVHHYPTSLPPPYKNVVVYVRVSSTLRAQLDSLANQVSGFVQLISKHNEWKLVDIYIDIRSGENQNQRLEFQRMLNEARTGKFDLVLTKSISRFGRNTEEAILALRKLNEAHVAVQFDEENLNSCEAGAEFVISILSAYAEGDNLPRRKNQLWGIQKRLEDGSSELYSRACYGYRKNDNGNLEIYEPEAEIVRMVYELYLSGASVHMIRKQLAAKGIKTAKGKVTWSKLAIERKVCGQRPHSKAAGKS